MREVADVQVGDMRDGEAFERGRQIRDRHIHFADAKMLELREGKSGDAERADRGRSAAGEADEIPPAHLRRGRRSGRALHRRHNSGDQLCQKSRQPEEHHRDDEKEVPKINPRQERRRARGSEAVQQGAKKGDEHESGNLRHSEKADPDLPSEPGVSQPAFAPKQPDEIAGQHEGEESEDEHDGG